MSKITNFSSRLDKQTVAKRQVDPNLRRARFGPIQPMDKPGFLARLLGRI